MIKHGDGLPEKQIRSAKLVPELFEAKQLTNTKCRVNHTSSSASAI